MPPGIETLYRRRGQVKDLSGLSREDLIEYTKVLVEKYDASDPIPCNIPINDKIITNKVLGAGTYGTVHIGCSFKDGVTDHAQCGYAVKIITIETRDRPGIPYRMFINEAIASIRASNATIGPTIFDIFTCTSSSDLHGVIIMERFDGSLHGVHLDNRHMTKIIHMVNYMHQALGIYHGDLFLKNMLYKATPEGTRFAITDFGTAVVWHERSVPPQVACYDIVSLLCGWYAIKPPITNPVSFHAIAQPTTLSQDEIVGHLKNYALQYGEKLVENALHDRISDASTIDIPHKTRPDGSVVTNPFETYKTIIDHMPYDMFKYYARILVKISVWTLADASPKDARKLVQDYVGHRLNLKN